jgi:serine/threonine protein kinase
MAPEQYLGTSQDERTDQYAFAVSLYEAIYGRRPFVAETLGALRDKILETDPELPRIGDVPDALINAISRGLSKSRRDRFAGMGELARLLESLIGDLDLTTTLAGSAGRAEAGRPSMYEDYMRALPDGLNSCPEHQVPGRFSQIILMQKPLPDPPPDMLPIIERVHSAPAIPAAHARALLSAIYDEHFESLDEFSEFMGQVSQTVMKMQFGLFTVPPPSSPVFVDAIVALYNRMVPGMTVRGFDKEQWTSMFEVDHPADMVNDVVRVSVAEAIRAAMLSAGASVAEVDVLDSCKASFTLKASWR